MTGFSPTRERDRGLDALGGHVGDFFIDELPGKCAAGAFEVAALQPLTGDAFQLTEEMQLRLFARIAIFVVKEMPREMEQDRR